MTTRIEINLDEIEAHARNNENTDDVLALVTEIRELRKERDFYKRYYDFSISKGAPDASPQLKGNK